MKFHARRTYPVKAWNFTID